MTWNAAMLLPIMFGLAVSVRRSSTRSSSTRSSSTRSSSTRSSSTRSSSERPWAGLGSKERTAWDSLDPVFAARLWRVYQRMIDRGFDPRLVQGHRELAEQATLRGDGFSDVSVSFHNYRDEAGRPAALAGDLADREVLWAEGRPDRVEHAARFFLALREEARAEGLVSGGDWSQRAPRRPQDADFRPWGLGWDPAHVETPRFRLSDVRNRLSTLGIA